MHAGDGNVHTNIPVHSHNYRMLQEADRIVDRIMQLAQSLGGVISRRTRHRPDQGAVPRERQARALRRVQGTGRSARSVFNRGKLMPDSGLDGAYTPVAAPGAAGSHHPRGERARRAQRRHQALPALRQVQTEVHDPRAARQPAVLAAQQDPRHRPGDRGLPVRGTDPSRHLARTLRRDERHRRSLHRLPQVRGPLPGRYRLRRRHHAHAQDPHRARQETLQCRHLGGDEVSQCHRPAHRQDHAQGHARLGLQGHLPWPTTWREKASCSASRATSRRRPPASRRSRRSWSSWCAGRCASSCRNARTAPSWASKTAR